jgi:putative membrane protein
MAFVSTADRARMHDAIKAAEAKTSGEFLTVIARSSHDYHFLPVVIAAGIALLAPGPLWAFGILRDFWLVYGLQLALFMVLALLLHTPPLLRLIVPRRVQRAHAHRLARELFHHFGMHRVAGGAGVLLFVSVFERHVEILADHGIHGKVPEGAWQEAVDGFIGAVRAGRVADGFIAAIAALGALLATHFPHQGGERNQVPDRLIEL